MVDGPACLTSEMPFTSRKSTSTMIVASNVAMQTSLPSSLVLVRSVQPRLLRRSLAPPKRAPRRSAIVRSAPLRSDCRRSPSAMFAARRLELVRSAPLRSDLLRFAPPSFASDRTAPARFARRRLASMRLARTRLASRRSALCRSAPRRAACLTFMALNALTSFRSSVTRSGSATGELQRVWCECALYCLQVAAPQRRRKSGVACPPLAIPGRSRENHAAGDATVARRGAACRGRFESGVRL